MKFEVLNEALGQLLTEENKTAYSEKENTILKNYRTGQNFLFYTAHDEELLFSELVCSFDKAPKMLEGSPRVLWFTAGNEHVLEIRRYFEHLYRRADVTLETADNKGKIIEQRNAIFEGTEILVGNPKRMLELYNQNGFHVNQLKLIIIDRTDTICKDPSALQAIRRINESLPKSQYLFFTEGKHPKLETFCEDLCSYYQKEHLD